MYLNKFKFLYSWSLEIQTKEYNENKNAMKKRDKQTYHFWNFTEVYTGLCYFQTDYFLYRLDIPECAIFYQ